MGRFGKPLHTFRGRLGAALAILAAALAGTLPAADQAPAIGKAALSVDEARQGFVPIFDGRTLNGWQGAVDGHEVVDGLLLQREGGATTLRIAYEKRVPFLYNIDLVGKFDKSVNLSGSGD